MGVAARHVAQLTAVRRIARAGVNLLIGLLPAQTGLQTKPVARHPQIHQAVAGEHLPVGVVGVVGQRALIQTKRVAHVVAGKHLLGRLKQHRRVVAHKLVAKPPGRERARRRLHGRTHRGLETPSLLLQRHGHMQAARALGLTQAGAKVLTRGRSLAKAQPARRRDRIADVAGIGLIAPGLGKAGLPVQLYALLAQGVAAHQLAKPHLTLQKLLAMRDKPLVGGLIVTRLFLANVLAHMRVQAQHGQPVLARPVCAALHHTAYLRLLAAVVGLGLIARRRLAVFSADALYGRQPALLAVVERRLRQPAQLGAERTPRTRARDSQVQRRQRRRRLGVVALGQLAAHRVAFVGRNTSFVIHDRPVARHNPIQRPAVSAPAQPVGRAAGVGRLAGSEIGLGVARHAQANTQLTLLRQALRLHQERATAKGTWQVGRPGLDHLQVGQQ